MFMSRSEIQSERGSSMSGLRPRSGLRSNPEVCEQTMSQMKDLIITVGDLDLDYLTVIMILDQPIATILAAPIPILEDGKAAVHMDLALLPRL